MIRSLFALIYATWLAFLERMRQRRVARRAAIQERGELISGRLIAAAAREKDLLAENAAMNKRIEQLSAQVELAKIENDGLQALHKRLTEGLRADIAEHVRRRVEAEEFMHGAERGEVEE